MHICSWITVKRETEQQGCCSNTRLPASHEHVVCLAGEWSIIQWTKNSSSLRWAHFPVLVIQSRAGSARWSPLVVSILSGVLCGHSIKHSHLLVGIYFSDRMLARHVQGSAVNPAEEKQTHTHTDTSASHTGIPHTAAVHCVCVNTVLLTKSWVSRHQSPLLFTHKYFINLYSNGWRQLYNFPKLLWIFGQWTNLKITFLYFINYIILPKDKVQLFPVES